MAVAGHDAGGNLAAGLAAMVRDQADFRFSAQALLAPLLDPSMTRIADLDSEKNPDMCAEECAFGYRAYLPVASHRMHPYAAPIESRRLKGLPAAFIASAENDLMHVEAEKYAAELIAAGVPTTVTRYRNVAHNELASRREVLSDVAAFFTKTLGATSKRS
jgi:acetyl esterase/lipase